MKKNKIQKIQLIVKTFEDRSVGIEGRDIPFNIELPKEYWDYFSEEEKKEMLQMLKETAVNLIDPDGECLTTEEIEEENLYWEQLSKQEE